MNRRAVLRNLALGGAGLLVAGSGLAGWRASRAGLLVADDAPFLPWQALAQARPGDPAGLAAAAILASNPHNTQPWRLRATTDHLIIEADTARHLGAFDPYRREMWIGLGAAIANAEIAAPGLGFSAAPPRLEKPGPDGAGRIVLDLQAMDPRADPLLQALAHRRTNRAAYAAEAVPAEKMQTAVAAAGTVPGARLELIDQGSDKARMFADATVAATEAINADAAMSHDGHVWFRPNARAVARHRDGVSIPTAGLSAFSATMGQLLPEPDMAASGAYWLASTRRQVAASGGFGLILVDDLDDREAQISAGRLWQRLHIALTAAGLAGQPINQLPEMVDRDRQLGRDPQWAMRLAELGRDDGKATFAFRFGVPLEEVPSSARRPLDWVTL